VTLDEFLQPAASGLTPATLALTFLGGILASALCPCTLPAGLGVAGLAGVSENRQRHGGLHIAVAFFAAVVLSLAVLGAFAGQIGALATEAFGRGWAGAMALLSLAAAVVAWRWPRMKYPALTAWRRPGVLGTFGYGLVFSIGTSVAPLLVLLAVTAGQGDTKLGVLLAFVFGLGRGLPFLLAGVAGSALVARTRIGSWTRAIQDASSAALLVLGIYYGNVFLSLL
jgi:cytochrome c-type biogenesis protein